MTKPSRIWVRGVGVALLLSMTGKVLYLMEVDRLQVVYLRNQHPNTERDLGIAFNMPAISSSPGLVAHHGTPHRRANNVSRHNSSIAVPELTTPREIAPNLNSTVEHAQDRASMEKNHSEIRDFERQERVVIATKVQGDQEYQIDDVKQSMCLLTAAYNNRVNYDIVVFTSHPWEEEDVKELESIVAPAVVKIVMDSPSVAEVVKTMSESGRQKLLDRCENVTVAEDFHWHTTCDDGKLRYNWQAEFRAKHIWTTPALAEYKYMLWMDSDGHCGAKWHQDPVATMIRNDLVILFDNFPGGTSRDVEVRNRVKSAFGDEYCGTGLEDGHLVGYQGNHCHFQQVHGFFHLTNLDFYRSAPVQKWTGHLIGDDHYRRAFDDQIGITAPAAILAPDKSWDMYSHNIKLKVVHNRFFDGKRRQLAGGYKSFWKTNAETEFPEAFETCSPHIKTNGR